MPLSNLGRYIGGRDMKAGSAAQIAAACNVSVEWLVAGTGPRSLRDALTEPIPAPPPARGLFGSIDMDRLVRAFDGAAGLFRARRAQPDARRILQATLLLYDEETDAGSRKDVD